MDLDPNQVTRWLDSHPDFLNEYLKKLQAKQRCDNILNDYLTLTTKSTSSAGEPGSSCSNSPAILSLALFGASGNATSPRRSSHLTSNAASNTSTGLSPASSSSRFVNHGTSLKLNPSVSEPNMFVSLLHSDEDKFNKQNNSNSPSSPKTPDINRIKFKQLNFYEKMYTLVKTLYRSLDLKITCKKILNTVSLLLDADRCSLFLVIDNGDLENNEDDGDEQMRTSTTEDPCGENGHTQPKSSKFLISVVFDAKSKSSHNSSFVEDSVAAAFSGRDEDEQIRIPYGVGIAGYVAATKQVLNIEDAYLDARFNPAIDQRTGYKTKSIMCLPILDENGECIAVAEAINKYNDISEIDLEEEQQQQQEEARNSNHDHQHKNKHENNRSESFDFNQPKCFTKEDEEASSFYLLTTTLSSGSVCNKTLFVFLYVDICQVHAVHIDSYTQLEPVYSVEAGGPDQQGAARAGHHCVRRVLDNR
jgi:dual 3',5'-cyclic-AMP and -GMP phosphodiesterase 11